MPPSHHRIAAMAALRSWQLGATGLVITITPRSGKSDYGDAPTARPLDRTARRSRCGQSRAGSGLRSRSKDVDMCLAIPGQVIEFVDDELRLAKVDVAGVRRTVNVGLLDGEDGGVGPGDWVLIHVGFALSKVDEEEAQATLELLRGMGADFEDAIEELKESVIG
jgi:hydrogenase expression/formation protein HypC